MGEEEIRTFDGVVLDVRKPGEYGEGHVPKSINIGLGGQFATWAGTLIPIGTPVAVVAVTTEQVDEAVMRLARVGHETVNGYILADALESHRNEVEQVSVEEASQRTQAEGLQFIDVRRSGEYENGHAAGSRNIPLDKLAERVDEVDPTLPTYVICQGGYRSSIGCGILENAGVNELYNVTGGTAAWIEAGLPVNED